VTPLWDSDQVASLNAYQDSGVFHEYTCGNNMCPALSVDAKSVLRATALGWECPVTGCGYTQGWALRVMADWSWRH
jgi:hypothetical protein